jgi:hypothetical protein
VKQFIFDAFGEVTKGPKKFIDDLVGAFGNFFSELANAFPTPPWVDDIKEFFSNLSFGGTSERDGNVKTGAIEETIGVDIPGTRFAKGGDFIVPPGFPNDTFPMRVQSGERVQVTPANQVAAGGDGALLAAMLRVAQLLEGRQVIDATITLDGKAIQRQILELDRRHARVSA